MLGKAEEMVKNKLPDDSDATAEVSSRLSKCHKSLDAMLFVGSMIVKEWVGTEEIANAFDVLATNDIRVGPAYHLRALRFALAAGVKFNDFKAFATALEEKSTYIKGALGAGMRIDDLKEFVLTLAQTTYETMVKSITIPDLKKGGGSKTRLASWLQEMTTAKFLGAESMQHQFETVLHIVQASELPVATVSKALAVIDKVGNDDAVADSPILMALKKTDKGHTSQTLVHMLHAAPCDVVSQGVYRAFCGPAIVDHIGDLHLVHLVHQGTRHEHPIGPAGA